MFGEKKKLDLKINFENNNDNVAQWGLKKIDPSVAKEKFNRFQTRNIGHALYKKSQQDKWNDTKVDGNNGQFNKSNPFRIGSGFQKKNQQGRWNDKTSAPHRKGGGNIGKKQFNNKPNPFGSKTPQVIRTEEATPWVKFKDDFNNRRREEEHASKQSNFDTEEGKKFLKDREKNYRKILMDEKKKEPIQWEDFGEEESQENSKPAVIENAQGKGKKKNKRNRKNNTTDQELLSSPDKKNEIEIGDTKSPETVEVAEEHVQGKRKKKNKRKRENNTMDQELLSPPEKKSKEELSNTKSPGTAEDTEGENVQGKKKNKRKTKNKNKQNVVNKSSKTGEATGTNAENVQRKNKTNKSAQEKESIMNKSQQLDPMNMTFKQKDVLRKMLTWANKVRRGELEDTVIHFKNVKEVVD
ncbi:uncharacterized protein [Musca autumnalis]|uniref:uncharacterized protein n=1 Tax=Musca autumnalis TaxID=221902 RepID=UPI003CEE9416